MSYQVPNYTLTQYGTPSDRFWRQVKRSGKNDCWLWTGDTTDNPNFPYGRTYWQGRKERTHRVAYLLTYGEFDRQLCVLHKCDNPPCCNPRHLFLGTRLDNTRDRQRKGRKRDQFSAKNNMFGKVGEQAPTSKLTETQVKAIRERYQPGITLDALGREFGVARQTVLNVIKRKSWRHI